MYVALSGQGLASCFLLVVVAPVTEELFFRGFVMTGFLKRYRPWTAIVLSSLLFSVFHLIPYQYFGAFVLGLVMAWLRWRTGSLWPCLLLHAAANGTVFVVGGLIDIQIPGFNDSSTPSFQPLWFDLTGVAMAAVGLTALAHVVSRRPVAPAANAG
jgi:uncharacterized protein